MSTPRSIAIATTLVLAGLTAAVRGDQSLTYPDLVGRLTDLARLATLPDRGETCAQWSSYDRASRYDEKTGKYVAWGANGDGNGVIRTEGDQVVMAEMKGPGCIWRIWSAAAARGHVKIYLDGQPEPAVDMPFAHYFDGKHAPFAYPALSYNLAEVHSSGQNLFVPIPYQKSCKVVADKGWGASLSCSSVSIRGDLLGLAIKNLDCGHRSYESQPWILEEKTLSGSSFNAH